MPSPSATALSSLSPAETGSNHGGKTDCKADGGEKMPQDNSVVNSVLERIMKLIKNLWQ